MIFHLSGNRERGDVSPEWRAVLMRDPCVYCGGEARGLDHIVASSRGGSDGWQNRAPACDACDSDKANASLLVFLYACRTGEVRTARRRYHDANCRRAAINMVRKKIADAFYRGNIRIAS